jgi:NSS family neurotransmitter:Na+ symporter
MQSNNSNSPQWSSRTAFILAAVGSSVGLGNLWRFSAEAGSNGGSAFIILYLACVLFIGIPAIMAEFLIGRAGQASSSINSFRDLTKRSGGNKLWNSAAWAGTVSAFLILSFYAVVAAWVMAYIPRFLSGAFDGQSATEIAAQFDQLIASPSDLMLYFIAFMAIVMWMVARGVNRGIELASKILMPSFFFLLVALCLFSIVSGWASGGTQQAISFMFSPDFSKLSASVAVSALGQAFFSIGLGMAMMMTYGSYLPKTVSLPRSAFIVGICDTMVALIAGLAIFPIVFQYGLDFEAGAGLFFQTLPTALIATPGGNIIGAAFFFMAIFAALTTGVALLEPAVAHTSEQLGMARGRATVLLGIAALVVGLGSLYSLEFMDLLDTKITAAVLMPFSALLIVTFVGWRLDRTIYNAEISDEDKALGGFLLFMLKYVAPLMITVILLAGIRSNYFPTLFGG